MAGMELEQHGPQGPQGPMEPKGAQTGLRLEQKIQPYRIPAQNFDTNPMDRVRTSENV